MIDKPVDSHVLGLEISSSLIKGAEILLKAKNIQLLKTYSFSLQEAHVNPLYILENNDLKKSIDSSLVSFSLSTKDVLVRSLTLPLKKEKDIQEVLAFQVEPLLPFSLEDAIIDSIKINTFEEGSLLTVIATKKQNIIDQLNAIKVEPEVITTEPSSLVTLANHLCKEEKNLCILYVDTDRSSVILTENQKLIAAQSASHNPDTAMSEIKRLLFSLTRSTKEEPPLLILGPAALVKELADLLESELNLKRVLPDLSSIEGLTNEILHEYAVALGTAISSLPNNKDLINFRQKELIYPHPWKKLLKPLSFYGGLTLALAFAFFLFSLSYHSYMKAEVKNQFIELISELDTSYENFEKDYEEKKQILSETVIPINALTTDELEKRVLFIRQKIQSYPDTFALFPNVPKVSDVLAWLSDTSLPMQIENFQYLLVKKPDQSKKNEKYQVKIELEFTSPTAKQAREFHDALITPNAFIDPKAEVKWNANKGRYKTSFFLKDKTIYPL